MFALTGATGHLGQTLLRQIRSSGDSVTVTVRDESQKELLCGYYSHAHVATLDNLQALTHAFEGCETVVHCAAAIDIRRGRREFMQKVNVDGTRNVIEACRRAGVQRLVYLSSIEAFDLSSKQRPILEETGFARGNSLTDYGKTKAEASLLVSTAGTNGTLETILICPTTIIGPWDFRNGYFTTMTHRFLRRRMPGSLHGGIDFVDVRDVAGAVMAATRKGRTGEAYLVSGEYLSIFELFERLERISGVRAPRLVFPDWMAAMGGEVSELWSRTTGRRVLFTRGSVDILQQDVRVESAKAVKELGYRSRPIDDTLNDLVLWIRDGLAINPDPLFA